MDNLPAHPEGADNTVNNQPEIPHEPVVEKESTAVKPPEDGETRNFMRPAPEAPRSKEGTGEAGYRLVKQLEPTAKPETPHQPTSSRIESIYQPSVSSETSEVLRHLVERSRLRNLRGMEKVKAV